MKLNLGCGKDVREGYVNVDLHPGPGVTVADLSAVPWPFENESADEVMMLDFLEHFEYRKTETIVAEAWRVLKPDGKLVVQVPDFEECAKAAMGVLPFDCNRCGWRIEIHSQRVQCPNCGQQEMEAVEAALKRLYGGQDYIGNYHYYAFTKDYLISVLGRLGFHGFSFEEQEHQRKNWNFKLTARKKDDLWS